ncbi:MAG: phosphoglycerate dehydrogenase [Armatimonadota bacterium]|jgi:D-3-phosphoglycerate dehydrogenase
MADRVMVLAAPFIRHEPAAGAPLRAAGVEVEHGPSDTCPSADELVELLRGCPAVIASMERYDERVLSELPELRLIARWGVGCDSIDLRAATEAGVIVANTPGTLQESVSDQTFALMLALSRRIPEQIEVARSLQWRHVEGVEIFRKTLGIIGLGSIGEAVARRAQGFSMRVLASDPYAPPERFEALGATSVSVDELVAEADIVTLHANLTEETRGIIGEAQLRAMKPEALFINCGRGGLVDQAALVRALEEGWIAGAGLDTLVDEPPDADDPILRAPNTIITPHNSSQTAESAARVNAAVCDNVLAVLNGERPRHVVNPDVFD